MNYHSDEWVMNKVNEHFNEVLKHFPEDRVVGIFAQGSMNYGLDYEGSDVDTKLIVVPTFDDIVFNRKAISTTCILGNEEHIDFKDLRLMLSTFRKQNLNFVEILFTPYKIVNPKYESYWNELVFENEKIAHYNPYSAVKTMKGIAMEKFHAMEHEYPSKVEVLAEFGYDGKQLHHLQRVEKFLEDYIAGEPYKKCLVPTNSEYLLKAKRCEYSLEEARKLANQSIQHVQDMANTFCETHKPTENFEADTVLNKVQSDIMKKAIQMELM